jgi:hypothetical protein
VYPTTEREDDGTDLEGGDESVGVFFRAWFFFWPLQFSSASPSSSSTLSVVILALSVVILGLDPRTQARRSGISWLIC